nr:AzlD domain-containing protein [Pseudomonas sp.]
MSQNLHWWLAVGVMGAITFLLRALPLAAHRPLSRSRLAADLNRRLPLCVMVILLLVSLKGTPADPSVLVSELLALALVAITYLRWRNPLLSVIAGVAALNGVGALVAAWMP